MKHRRAKTVLPLFIAAGITALIALLPPANAYTAQAEWHPADNISTKDPAQIREAYPVKGKIRGNVHPTEAVFGQIFVNTKDGREWIYDGHQWVPHDNTVDAYYEAQKGMKKPPLPTNCPPQAEGGN